MYACGTFAFSPRCVYLDVQTLSMSQQLDEGRGRCPYDPYQANTAISVDGELYTGTVADYRGNRPVISRHLSEGGRRDLKLDDTLGWLDEPTFSGSVFVLEEEKVFFFFSEVGREFDFMERLMVSRVAQICTSDVGGQRTLQKRWTTFAKAQLLCQEDGELPFNLIQDIDTLSALEGADDTLFYAVFTSQWPLRLGRSAVCAFSLRSIRAVFSGSYKALNRDTLQWTSRLQEKSASPGECGLHNASDSALRFVKENFLAEESVRALDRSLTLVSQHLYRHIRVQRVRVANGRHYTTLFLLTDSGFVHKVVLLGTGAHVIEEIQVFQPPQAITSMKLSEGVIFIGTSEGIVRLPLTNCSIYRTCAQCVLSRDPFCGWDRSRRECVEVVHPLGPALVQDMERAQVDEVCVPPFGPHIPTAPCPPGVLVRVSLNEVVVLHCPALSLLSQQQWQRPNSRLSEQLYLQLHNGSLSFVATPATLGHYLCVSTESGFQQTMAVYQVRQNSGPPMSPAPSTRPLTELRSQPRGPILPTAPTIHTDKSVLREWVPGGPCYLKELLIVSGLLVLCVSLLLTLLMYTIRLHCHNRTHPQPIRHRGSPQPPIPPRHRGSLEPQPKGQYSANSSNGHLPNTADSRMSQVDKDLPPVPGQDPPPVLTPGQLQSHLKMEPKTLGAVQIVIAALILCLSSSVLNVHEVHFNEDIALFFVTFVQVTLSGSVLIHSARRPTLFWVKCMLVLHLVSAAFATAALGLLSKHLPYRQDSYHCEHCRRLELHAVQHCFRKCTGLIEQKCKLLIDGILGTLVIFLVLELLVCITVMLFGLSVLAAGGRQSGSQRPVYPQTRPPPAPAVSTSPATPLQASPLQASPLQASPSQVAVVVTEVDSEPVEELSTPPTEPQVEPIEVITPEP
uniref:Sema domain-containing protein n=1 Tax=Knipowitschia caucasica TaxID=637954 RepID=A0AAV2KLX6_KNICA